MRSTIPYSKIKKRNLVLINNDTYQRETLSERPIRQPLRRSRDMLILIEWHKNISVQTVACIVKHEDPQINSVRGVFSKFAVR